MEFRALKMAWRRIPASSARSPTVSSEVGMRPLLSKWLTASLNGMGFVRSTITR